MIEISRVISATTDTGFNTKLYDHLALGWKLKGELQIATTSTISPASCSRMVTTTYSVLVSKLFTEEEVKEGMRKMV